MNELPFSPRIDRTYSKPKLVLPPGSCDCHFHFIGPQVHFPLLENHVFSHLQFEDTTFSDWEIMQDSLGLSRGLHVQSMMYGRNYEIALHAQCRYPDRLRTVVNLPWDEITDRELTILTESGVVGARVSWRIEKNLNSRMIDRLTDFGWSIHYLVRTAELDEEWAKIILATSGNFVIEHTGYPPADKGADSKEFSFVMECLETGRGWIKLSPRFSNQDTFPFDDTNNFIFKLTAASPDKLLWGSDWPHPQYFKPMPNDVSLLDMMLDWIPDEKIRNLIMVENPAKLFGFPQLS
jgi:predicted TIM-barrel fold metal-dependent hydrolase|tara:strand:- start:3295 stop:4173 length:879 start_codon:yes stop_codon:yes gene_type:complete